MATAGQDIIRQYHLAKPVIGGGPADFIPPVMVRLGMRIPKTS